MIKPSRCNPSVIFLFCFSLVLLYTGSFNSAYAYPEKIVTEQQQNTTNRIYGKVTETFDVSGYTYAEVDDGKKKVWAAGPVTQLKPGDMIAFSSDMPMQNYRSKSMERDFSIIYFVERFISDKQMPSTTAGATTVDTAIDDATAAPHDFLKKGQAAKLVKEIKKAEGGNTIAEIHKQKQQLNGKTIRVRGLVTKVTNQVMGKNWLHVRDSSTLEDLTITTMGTAAIDDVVVIEGRLELDKDFGYGYVYPVIVEDASVVKE